MDAAGPVRELRTSVAELDGAPAVTAIGARIPQVDWSKGFERHWCGGDAAATHAFNALSFLFPQGERFFIEATRVVARGVDLAGNPGLAQAVAGFIGQESMHARQHARYNAVLEEQGFANVVHAYIARLQGFSERRLAPVTRLAVVCGYEHYTAILGNYILRNPRVLAPAAPDMALIWGWHSAEETEHKAVCFDLYRFAGGGWLRRALVFLPVSLNFSLMFGRLYLSLLYRDGCLKPQRLAVTAWHCARFFFGASGVAWHLLWHGVRYLGPWFHPWNQDNRRELQAWLRANQARLEDAEPRGARCTQAKARRKA